MDDLIIKSLQGHTTAEEDARLAEWRESDPANERTWQEAREIWLLTGEAVPVLAPEMEKPPEFFTLLSERSEEVNERQVAVIPLRKRAAKSDRFAPSESTWLRRAAMGAIAASLIAVGVGLGSFRDRGVSSSLLSNGEIVTGLGEMTTVTLGDGTSIRLGPESRLRLAEETDRRLAWLEGRAFFSVQSDSLRPFVVQTDHGEAVVLGTRFEVQTGGEDFRVLVVEGQVSVESGDSAVKVSIGEEGRGARGEAPSTQVSENVFAQMEWLGNAVMFQTTPLSLAVEEIEERYDVEVSIDDPSLSDLSVTASFTGRPVGEMLLVLCQIVGAECVVGPDDVYHILR